MDFRSRGSRVDVRHPGTGVLDAAIAWKMIRSKMAHHHDHASNAPCAERGIRLPSEDLDKISLYGARLRHWGSLTEINERSDEEHEREVRLVETLRTILVAMVAASVGYHGVIRGVGYNEGPPSWWHVDPDEEKGIHRYVAVNAPAPANIPPLASGEVLVIVEHHHHRTIVEHLLYAAALPAARVRILVADGRAGLRDLTHAAQVSPVALLAGTKQRNVPNAEEDLRKELASRTTRPSSPPSPTSKPGSWPTTTSSAVPRPTIPTSSAGSMPCLSRRRGRSLRLCSPRPRALRTWSMLREADIYRASVRSPSLRRFLSWMAEALGVHLDLPVESAEPNASATPSRPHP